MMLKGINSHFSSKQKLHFSTRTHWERFQPAHAVTWIHCPDGRFKPKGMGLENAKSSPHSSHLHGLWMKRSGSGIPGERGPHASHTPCNVLHFQVPPFSMSRSILMPMFPVSSPPLLLIITSPVQACSPPQLSPLREETQTLGIFHNSETLGQRFVPPSIPSNKLTWYQARNARHGIHKHPWRAHWNPLPRAGWKTL